MMIQPGRDAHSNGMWSEGPRADTGERAPRAPQAPAFVSRRRKRLLAGESGQGIVEFAMVLPLLAALVFAFIAFGKAVYYYIELTHVANEGARLASVNPGSLPNGSPTLKAYLCSQFGTNSELYKGSGTVTPTAVTISYPDGGKQTVGEPIAVDVKTTYSWFPFMNLGSFAIDGSATMRIEQDTTNNAALTGGTCS
jgi:hypothetical protein